MDSEHQKYLREFFDELSKLGFTTTPLPRNVVEWLNQLANEGETPKQAAQIVWLRLKSDYGI
jgi:hypothetical protein